MQTGLGLGLVSTNSIKPALHCKHTTKSNFYSPISGSLISPGILYAYDYTIYKCTLILLQNP